MEEKNELEIFRRPLATPRAIDTARGRPQKQKEIKFSAQPKSLVSQLLSKLKDDPNRTLIIDLNGSTKDSENMVIVEENEIEEVIHQKEFNCVFCTFRSDDASEHKNHLRTHKQFTCDYPDCSYSCKLSSNLTKHKRIHTGEKPYLCDQCSFRSNFINSLKVHKRIHTSERPYACIDCSYRCNSSWNLKKHRFHRHLNELKTT